MANRQSFQLRTSQRRLRKQQHPIGFLLSNGRRLRRDSGLVTKRIMMALRKRARLASTISQDFSQKRSTIRTGTRARAAHGPDGIAAKFWCAPVRLIEKPSPHHWHNTIMTSLLLKTWSRDWDACGKSGWT